MRYVLLPALLALAGVLTAAETAQAQVRVVVGVGGRPGYYSRGYYPYPRYYYPAPVVVGVGPVVVPREAYYAPPAVAVEPLQAAPAAPAVASNAANIRVLVPDPNAKVWFDGTLTSQGGTDRLYHTPSLSPGSAYSYRIRASWTQSGQPIVQEVVVPVTPGQTAVADFTKPLSEPLPLPK